MGRSKSLCLHGVLGIKNCSSCAVERTRQWRLKNARKNEYGPKSLNRYMAWVAKNKERNFAIQKEHKLKKNFGITIKDYENMLIQQGGKCAVCGVLPTNRRHAVDHNHKTGKVRGLLCWRCNRTIGAFEDNPELLRKAIEYLERTDGDQA